MAYLTKSDLYTLIYQEVLDEISRADDTIPTRAIAAALAEAKAYLSRFNLTALFGTNTDGPTVPDEFLRNLVKDLAAWQIIKLANPNINTEHLRQCYEDAIRTLSKIQRGDMVPQGWPYYVPPTQDPQPGNPIYWSSNTKQNNDI